jgi:hypothetical protein
MNQKGKCSSKQEPVAGGMNVSYTCTDPASSGNGQIRFNGDSAYTMTMHVTNTTPAARKSTWNRAAAGSAPLARPSH